MFNYKKFGAPRLLMGIGFWLLAFFPLALFAQHGHPLVGTWSGYFNQATSEPVRVLFTFSFSAEQIISGAFILNGQRFNYTRAELDPKAWTVTLEAQGKDKAGNMLTYSLVGKFEKLDSPTDRTLVGVWQEGSTKGDFSIVIN